MAMRYLQVRSRLRVSLSSLYALFFLVSCSQSTEQNLSEKPENLSQSKLIKYGINNYDQCRGIYKPLKILTDRIFYEKTSCAAVHEGPMIQKCQQAEQLLTTLPKYVQLLFGEARVYFVISENTQKICSSRKQNQEHLQPLKNIDDSGCAFLVSTPKYNLNAPVVVVDRYKLSGLEVLRNFGLIYWLYFSKTEGSNTPILTKDALQTNIENFADSKCSAETARAMKQKSPAQYSAYLQKELEHGASIQKAFQMRTSRTLKNPWQEAFHPVLSSSINPITLEIEFESFEDDSFHHWKFDERQ